MVKINIRKYFPLVLVFLVLACMDSHGDKKAYNTPSTNNIPVNTNGQNDSLFTSKYALKPDAIDSKNLQFFKIDSEKSMLIWSCVTHTGYVKFKGGDIGVLNDSIVSGKFAVAMDSIRDTDISYDLMRQVLDNTLKSDSFFQVNKYPLSILTLTHLKNIGGQKYLVGANLQIKEITKPIKFTAQIRHSDSSIVVLTNSFAVDRTKWGITIYSKNFKQSDKSFLFTDSVKIKVAAIFHKR